MDEAPVRRAWGVAALLLAAADALAARFGAVTVQGELSAFTRASSGHCYFTLKDADGAPSQLRCAMFRRAASLLDFAPADGQRVELTGRLTVYDARGDLQFVVESMRRSGSGHLYEQFLRLKAKLQAEGLFDAARKRVLPAHPQRIGVVTSLAAAALHDIVSTLARRAPHVQLLIYPSLVQGADAPDALAAALRLAGRRAEVDVLILARGGGSLEDLWAFNDERVVRAVAASPLPVIAGVGHDTDITLVDFVADVRAATPTAAAECAAPARDDALLVLHGLAQRAARQMTRRLEADAQRLDARALQLAQPSRALALRRAALERTGQRLAQASLALRTRLDRTATRHAQGLMDAARARLSSERSSLSVIAARLDALAPQRVLRRGYAWVQDAHGRAIVSARALHDGQVVRAVWHDGHAQARVTEVEPGIE